MAETLVSPVCLFTCICITVNIKVKTNEAGVYSHLNDCKIYHIKIETPICIYGNKCGHFIFPDLKLKFILLWTVINNFKLLRLLVLSLALKRENIFNAVSAEGVQE